MENTTPISPLPSKKVIKISKKKLIWTIIIIVILFFVFSGTRVLKRTFSGNNSNSRMIQVPCIASPGVNCPDNKKGYDNYNNNSNAPLISDTREFNKVSYKADISTRNVEKIMDGVKEAIDDAEGRIDNLNDSTKYGHATFVVPKTNFDDFKDEIESLTHKKLYISTTSSNNLLSQKQSIEGQTDTAENTLLGLQTQQKSLTSKHTQTLSALQKELANVQGQIGGVKALIAKTADNTEVSILQTEQTNLSQQETTIKQKIAVENSSYNSNYQSLQNQINGTNTTLTNLDKQDETFMENIETVNGAIYVKWVSLWDLAKLLSPIHPTYIVIALGLILGYYLRKKNYIPGVEFV